jgi:hypothetical protein
MKKVLIGITIFILIAVIVIILLLKNKKEEVVVEPVEQELQDTIKIVVNETELIVNLEDNRTKKALLEKLDEGDIIINAQDYSNFEKVGDLGFNLPRSDKYTKTEPGDVILYSGNQIVLFYGTNTWNYTKIGKINITGEELKSILGDGDITYTITK